MRRVIVESPFAGRHGAKCVCADCAADVERNQRYTRAALHDCFLRGEAPFASHAIYTLEGVLRDTDAAERALGIQAGFVWREVADATVVYSDLGTSTGMRYGIIDAEKLGHAIEYRTLPGWAQPAPSSPSTTEEG